MRQQILESLSSAKRYVQWSLTRLEHCKRYPEGAQFDGNLYKDSEGRVWKQRYVREPTCHWSWVVLQREGLNPWEETDVSVTEGSHVNTEEGTLINGTLSLTRIKEEDDAGWSIPKNERDRRDSSKRYAEQSLTLHQIEVAFYAHLSEIPEGDLLAWCDKEGQLAPRVSDQDWTRFLLQFAPSFMPHSRDILHDALLCTIHTRIDQAAGIQRTWCY